MKAQREAALLALKLFVQEYKAHNDAFEASLRERHARWEERGLLREVPKAKHR